MNQSETNTEEGCSSGDSPPPSPKGIDLSAIPHFSTSTGERQPQSMSSQSLAPPSCNEREPTFEYEFSVCPSGGTPLFVTLWDTDDLSAAQRACCCNLLKEQITYSPTGNAFFKVRDEDWCFKKEPYQGSWSTHNQVEVQPNEIKPIHHKSSPITADAILATL